MGAARSTELWQMDVVGGIGLADGGELKALTGIDDHSRFCMSAALMPRATARPVRAALTAALERHGIPEEILTDGDLGQRGLHQQWRAEPRGLLQIPDSGRP